MSAWRLWPVARSVIHTAGAGASDITDFESLSTLSLCSKPQWPRPSGSERRTQRVGSVSIWSLMRRSMSSATAVGPLLSAMERESESVAAATPASLRLSGPRCPRSRLGPAPLLHTQRGSRKQGDRSLLPLHL
ncbi:hypothetical protein Q4I32_000211 [Leishmania shawi]|uniref:Uncharacterized protein n=1 Tax=Leishmania shawi TaxID=5680 RepID=A0AAW3CDJ4_9TRYP